MMKHVRTMIIGGGASGLMLANALQGDFLLLERGERVGKKLSATGNGQGNVTNVQMNASHFFSVAKKDEERLTAYLNEFGYEKLICFFEKLGGLFLADERGRVYPTGRQASALCDLLRKPLEQRGRILLSHKVERIEKQGDLFVLTVDVNGNEEQYASEKVVVATGGKAAKNFGSDGNGYELVAPFLHKTTALYPSLVQLKTATKDTKSLKGVRIAGATLWASVNDQKIAEQKGDVLFTEYGVSGDAVFHLSAFLAGRKEAIDLHVDLLPNVSMEKLEKVIESKQKAGFAKEELLCGIVNNQVGRCVMKRTPSFLARDIARTVKDFSLPFLGTLGFDYAQVTKGGIPLEDTDETLQSKKVKGLYFIGEILDVDGACGGYNLQWAFTSAMVVAKGLHE